MDPTSSPLTPRSIIRLLICSPKQAGLNLLAASGWADVAVLLSPGSSQELHWWPHLSTSQEESGAWAKSRQPRLQSTIKAPVERKVAQQGLSTAKIDLVVQQVPACGPSPSRFCDGLSSPLSAACSFCWQDLYRSLAWAWKTYPSWPRRRSA